VQTAAVTSDVAKVIAIDKMPASIVEGKGWKEFFSKTSLLMHWKVVF